MEIDSFPIKNHRKMNDPYGKTTKNHRKINIRKCRYTKNLRKIKKIPGSFTTNYRKTYKNPTKVFPIHHNPEANEGVIRQRYKRHGSKRVKCIAWVQAACARAGAQMPQVRGWTGWLW